MDFKVNNISPHLLKKAKELATNAEKTPGGNITQNEVEQLLKEANKDGKITVSESQFIAGLTSEQNVKKLLQSNFNPVKGEIQFQGVSRIRLREIHQKAVTINNATRSLKLDIQNLRSGTDGNIPQDMQARIEYVLKDLPNHNSELAKQLAPLLTKESSAFSSLWPQQWTPALATGGSPLKSPNMMMAKDPSKISQTSGKSAIERVFDETG
jgi:hypothetical protein